MNNLSRIEDLIERYLEDKVSEEERSEILRLIQEGRVSKIVKEKIGQSLSDRFRAKELPDAALSIKGEEIFNAILRKNELSDKTPPHFQTQHRYIKNTGGKYRAVLRYAAAFIILAIAGLFAYPWQTPNPNKVITRSSPAAEMVKVVNSGDAAQKVTLQDGSTVTLEPGGEVRYNENFLSCREVYLSGDAFFEVIKDPVHPFFVYANEITTKVLGTSFRVKANKGEKEIVVAVKTGKVSVFAKATNKNAQAKDLQEITLTPNQQATYKRTEQVVVKEIVEEPQVISIQAARKDSYVNEPVVLILEALSESYGVDIRFDKASLKDCTLTSDIIEGEGLYDQLEIVCNALGGTYKMENDASIVIEANGCRSMNVKP